MLHLHAPAGLQILLKIPRILIRTVQIVQIIQRRIWIIAQYVSTEILGHIGIAMLCRFSRSHSSMHIPQIKYSV